MKKTALIAMSGGVDSSVAAFLTKEDGFDCIAGTMKLYTNEDAGVSCKKGCCSLEDVEDARSVAHRLHIPFYVFNFTDCFTEQVINRFINAYKAGETPNPCIDCNRFLKFDRFLRRAREINRDYVVTGHYARICYDEISGRYLLKKGIDPAKDQSYVLYTMTQEQLSRTRFPLGELTKVQVREIAHDQNFPTAKKRESQDICFVPDGDYSSFIEWYTGEKVKTGLFTDKFGNPLGEHKGIIHYTVGQRRGIGLSLQKPVYVCEINHKTNTVVLGSEEDLYTQDLTIKDINLIPFDSLDKPLRIKAKIRYRQPEQSGVVTQTHADTLHIHFDIPQRAVTKGQAAVLYSGDIVIGGGTII